MPPQDILEVMIWRLAKWVVSIKKGIKNVLLDNNTKTWEASMRCGIKRNWLCCAVLLHLVF